jgi:hypothetical protein
MFKQTGAVVALILLLFGFQTAGAADKIFSNPLLKNQNSGCTAGNLNQSRFSANLKASERILLCQSVASVAKRLNQGKWSAELGGELTEIWRNFAQEDVFFAEMPAGKSSDILALTESFPPGRSRSRFSAVIYLKNDVADKKWFYHVFLHELRHVYDFDDLFARGYDLPTVELERRAFHLMSLMDEETPDAIRFSKVPQLWKDKWKELPRNIRDYKRDEAISNFLKKAEFYRDLPPQIAVWTGVAIKPDYDDEFGAPPKLRRRVPKASPTDSAATEASRP